jgi:ParB-like chromosome segregation protein Spo0J
MQIRDRIKELRRVPASELKPNPKNWRKHPAAQANALRGVLAEVGIADAVIARELEDGTLLLLDGHLRAETMGQTIVPVLILDVDEAEGDKILATLDPLAAMAEADAIKLDAILREVDTGSAEVQEMLAKIAEEAGLYEAGETAPPELAEGDRQPFRQMTFTVHDSQHELVEAAISKAKQSGGDSSGVNENSNGNALAFICKAYLDG